MYAQAHKVGLPALLVDIRHEAAHGDAPNLTNLRAAAERALRWLWDDYWKGLGEGGGEVTMGVEDKEEEEQQPGRWQRWQGSWTPKPIGTV